MHIHELVVRYGWFFYPLVFLWTFIEGETVVILSGAASRKGFVSLPLLVGVAWAGSFLGDQFWFVIARHLGTHVTARFPSMVPAIQMATRTLERNNTLFILSYRFVYGMRNVASMVIGASEISWTRFAILNFISAGVWSVTFAGGGYLAGREIEDFVGVAGWTSVAFLAISLGAAGFAYHRRSKSRSTV